MAQGRTDFNFGDFTGTLGFGDDDEITMSRPRVRDNMARRLDFSTWDHEEDWGGGGGVGNSPYDMKGDGKGELTEDLIRIGGG